MASTQTKLRRGTEAQCEAMTPVEAEVVVDLTNDRLRLGDGTTAGGIIIPNAFDIQKGAFNSGAVTGTNTLTVTLDPVPAGYTTDMEITLKIATTNTTAVTVNVNSLGAKDLQKVDGGALVALAGGDLVSGGYYTFRYDGTRFVMVGASGGGVSSVTGSAGILVAPTTGTPVVSIDTNNALGIGAIAILRNTSSSIAAGATSTSLNLTTINSTGSILNSGVTAGGTWRNISGQTVITNAFALFIRTA